MPCILIVITMDTLIAEMERAERIDSSQEEPYYSPYDRLIFLQHMYPVHDKNKWAIIKQIALREPFIGTHLNALKRTLKPGTE